MKIRLIQPGQPDVHLDVSGDAVTVGRSPECDVVVAQSYVSKQHVRILRGLVAVDLQSSNGTFLAGDQLEPAAVFDGQRIRLGPDEVYLEVIDQPLRDAEQSMEAGALKLKNDALAFELEELKKKGEELVAKAEAGREAEASQRADLQRRLDSMKQELKAKAADDGASLEAKLAQDQLAQVQTKNEELEKEITALREAQVAATADEGMAGELEALRVLRKEQEEKIADLEKHAATPASDLFFQQQGEARKLRERIAELEAQLAEPTPAAPAPAADPAPATADPGQFFKLQAENHELRRQLEEAGDAAPADDVVPAADLAAAKQRADELAAEVARLTALAAQPAPAEPTPVAPVAPTTPPAVPATPVGAESGVTGLLRSIASADVEGRAPLYTEPAEQFLTLESFRFLRQVEKVVTRMAGGFIQLYQLRTVLPDVEGTMRGLVDGILDDPAEREPREDFVQYIEELRKWLVVSLGAYRQASERFAEELKGDLNERSLTAEAPIPAYKKIAGQADAELWRRAQAYLQQLTPDNVDDRLEKLARAAAQEILKSTSGEAGGDANASS